MGLGESQPEQMNIISKRNHSWKVTSIDLNKKLIKINQTPYTFGRHQLGHGAFGTVYPARRMTDGVEVAIKVISLSSSPSLSPILVESFLNEISQSKRLSYQSKHVVQMFDFDFHKNGLAFIVMERGDQDLEKSLYHKATLSIDQQRTLWKQIINILITLHRHSIVHLDLKPSNLVYFGERLKLVDLGIAQKANSRGNGPNGTFGFSAPEVRIIPDGVLPRYTHKADIWSIGAILYWINYRHAPKYDYSDNSFRPPSGISSCKDRNVVDILQHTLRMNPHQRSETNWLARHPFIRSA